MGVASGGEKRERRSAQSAHRRGMILERIPVFFLRVIPAQAGIHKPLKLKQIPACAGMTIERASRSTPLPTSPLSREEREWKPPVPLRSPLQGEGRGGGRVKGREARKAIRTIRTPSGHGPRTDSVFFLRVIPAQAGIQKPLKLKQIPAFAGMTIERASRSTPLPTSPPVQRGGASMARSVPLVLPLPCRGRVGVGVASGGERWKPPRPRAYDPRNRGVGTGAGETP